MNEKIIVDFPVTIFGELEKFSTTMSRARCRIFYKYNNRNGTFISDEFSDKLLASLPYTPVKAIFDSEEEDFTDHGKERKEGRIYGIVPENPNISWEKFLDDDGIEREYACCDVLIFSALYDETKEIVGKSQSMELYPPSITGKWVIIEGKKLYKYEEGVFLGLQILGDSVEPCFEGAAFYSMIDRFENFIKQAKEYRLIHEKGGESKMTINFKLSDSQKHSALWSLLNNSFNEEGDFTVSYAIAEVFDEYAIVYSYETGEYQRAYYKKDDATDSVEILRTEKCYIIDVTESEKNSLETLKQYNGNTYEKVEEIPTTVTSEVTEKITEEFSSKIAELNNSISTLTSERDEKISAYEEIFSQVESLKTFKVEKETQEKEQVIESYSKMLDEEVLASYRAKIAEFDILSLDKELTYELKKNSPNIFSKEAFYVPNDELPKGGIEGILDKYQKTK